MILAGDIGGTKTVLALLETSGLGAARVREGRYASREHGTLEAILDAFLGEAGRPRIDAACLSIAGPVLEGEVKATNLPWAVSEAALAARLGTPRVRLLNDLEAAAHAMPHLTGDAVLVLQAGVTRPGHFAVIAAGTGLGEAIGYWDGTRHHPFASEGGHVDFAPRTDVEADLLRFLAAEFGRVSCERVVSGPGLFNVYRFLRDTGRGHEPPWLATRLPAEDPSAVVAEAALAGEAPLCAAALDLFVSIYGAQAGNLALTALALGGLYVAGGIAPKIRRKLEDGTFMRAFLAKGRLSGLLAEIPVRVCLDPYAPLDGAARVARGLGV